MSQDALSGGSQQRKHKQSLTFMTKVLFAIPIPVDRVDQTLGWHQRVNHCRQNPTGITGEGIKNKASAKAEEWNALHRGPALRASTPTAVFAGAKYVTQSCQNRREKQKQLETD